MSDIKKPKRKFTRRTLFTAAGITSLVASGYLLFDYTQMQNDLNNAPKDMNGNAIKLDTPLSESEIDQMDIENLNTLRIQVDDLGLNSLVSTMVSVDGVINPPDATRTFLLRDYGTSLDKPAEGTLYAVAHSLKSGVGPGNYLFDWENDKILVKEGNIIKIGELEYKVSNVDLSQKTNIGDHENIWNNDPNKLVFITCLQRREGKSLQNLIVEAELIE